MKTPTVSFDVNAVAPLALFMAKHDIRFYLAGLYVTPAPNGHGCILAATNGHQMAIWHDPNGECSADTILAIGKPMIKASQESGTAARKVKLADGKLALIDSDGADVFIQAGEPVIDAKYPNIWSVIPDNGRLTPGLHGCVATRLMHRISKAGKLIARQFGCGIAASHYTAGNDGTGCVLTRFEGASNFIVITMPVRSQTPYPDEQPRPACFAPPIRPAIEATANFPCGSMGEEVAA